MNQTTLENPKKLRHKIPIVIFSIVALVFKVLSSISFFSTYDGDWEEGYELSFHFPDVMQLVPFILGFLPYVLLVIYIQKFHKEFKATIIVPIIYASIAVEPVISIINNILFGLYGFAFSGVISDTILNLILSGTFALATISALKGLSNKTFIIVPTATVLALNTLSLLGGFSSFSFYIDNGMVLHLFTVFARVIASMALNAALLIFGLKNRIPTILSVSSEKEKKNIEKMTPEQALKSLKNKFELGIITEEEYQSQRAEIIRKL